MIGWVFFSLTIALLEKLESKYFSRTLSFLVNSAISALASRNVPFVVGQNVGPFSKRDTSPLFRCRRDRLMTLTFS